MTHASPQKVLDQIISQLKNRKVVRVGFAYVFVSWLVIQVADVTVEALVLPSWSLSLITILLMLGFPIALILAWAYEITPKGIVRDLEGRVSAASANPDPDNWSVSSNDVKTENPTVAVLPLEDMSPEGNLGYFCKGLAEEITMTLCSTGIHVATHLGSSKFVSKCANVAEIGRRLGVSAFLEGSVRKFGNNLRVTIQLVDVAQGYQLWSAQYDRQMVDILEIQTELAHLVVSSLQKAGSFLEHARGEMYSNQQAYEFYLRGQAYFSRLSRTNIRFAQKMFQKAIDSDPKCGRAWAQLACTYACDYLYFHASSDYRDRARQLSITALEIAPDRAQSHIARGVAHSLFAEYKAADREFQQAIELNPRLFDAWYMYARCKVHQKDPRQAVKLFEKAASVRPKDYQCLILQAAQLSKLGEEKASIAALREGLKRAKSFLELNPDDSRAWNLGAFALLTLGQDEEADIWMSNSLRRATRRSTLTYNAACFYAQKGELEKSLEFLEQCIGVGIITKQWIEHDMDLDPVRKFPRFEDIVARLPVEETREKDGENIPTAHTAPNDNEPGNHAY